MDHNKTELSNTRISLDKNILSEFLSDIKSMNCVIAFVYVWSKDEKGIGLLEKKGNWIERFAKYVSIEFQDCWISRELWNSLFLAFPSNGIYEVENRLTAILTDQLDINLEILCAIDLITGNLNEKICQIDEIASSVSNMRNFHQYKGRLVRLYNGVRILESS